MHGLNNINFNTISYDAGLTLVKEAKDRGSIKKAEGEAGGAGILDAVMTFVKDNPEFLKRLGIGTAIGGGLGVASGLMGDPRTRKPIRRGLTGALLGALGGGMWGAAPELSRIYGRGRATESIKNFANEKMREGWSPEKITRALVAQSEQSGLDISADDISAAIPEPPASSESVLAPFLKAPAPDSFGWSDIPAHLRLGIMGGASGFATGEPISQRLAIDRAALKGESPDVANFAKQLGTQKTDGGGSEPVNEELSDAVKTIRRHKKQRSDPNYTLGRSKFVTKLPFKEQPVAFQRPWEFVKKLNRFQQSFQPKPPGFHFRSPVRGSTPTESTAYTDLIKSRQQVFDALGRPRYHRRGAGAGAILGLLLPELVRGARSVGISPIANLFSGSNIDTSSVEDALRQL